MNNLEDSVIRSRELKENGIELKGVDVSKDILVKSDTTITLKDNKDNIIKNTSVNPTDLENALQNEKTIDFKDEPEDSLNLQYTNYKRILDNNINNYYSVDFSTAPYVELDTDDNSSLAILKINDALIINSDNVLLDEPIVIKSENVDNLVETKERIESADDIHLYSEDERLQIELQNHKTYTVKEAFEGEIMNAIICGIFVLLFIPVSIWIAIFCAVFVISLFTKEIMKSFKGKKVKRRYFVDYGLSNNCRINNVTDINEEKYYNINISEENSRIIMKADEIEAEWQIKNEGVLPDKFVALFENIGFENINTDSLELKIRPTYKTPNVENYLISECGIWCINPEQSIQQEISSEKVLQYN